MTRGTNEATAKYVVPMSEIVRSCDRIVGLSV